MNREMETKLRALKTERAIVGSQLETVIARLRQRLGDPLVDEEQKILIRERLVTLVEYMDKNVQTKTAKIAPSNGTA